MRDLQITPLAGYPGGECFLFLTPKSAVLVDTGFDFSAGRLLAQLREKLNGRPLDYILLTHSHYDHANGCGVLQQAYPGVKVAAHPLVRQILAKESARATMRELNEVAARRAGIAYRPTIDRIRIDRDVLEGDIISLPDMSIRVLETPGHTRCSICFYFEEDDVLASCETSCIQLAGRIIAEFVVSYAASLRSIDKCAAIGAGRIALTHGGVLEGADASGYFARARSATQEAAELVISLHRQGVDERAILSAFTEKYYDDTLAKIQTIEAFELNSVAMISRLISETAAQTA